MPALRSLRLAHPLLRTSSSISFRRSGNTTILPAVVTPLSLKVRLVSTGGYGDPEGGPMSENPQGQGARTRNDTEHPGAEPVAEGQASQQRSSGGTGGKTTAQPKIHSEPQPPGKGSSDAEAHNKSMGERSHSEVAKDDQVAGKGYWKGQ